MDERDKRAGEGPRRTTASLVGVAEIAKRAGVHYTTVHEWVKAKKLRVHSRVSERGALLFEEADVAAYLAERNAEAKSA